MIGVAKISAAQATFRNKPWVVWILLPVLLLVLAKTPMESELSRMHRELRYGSTRHYLKMRDAFSQEMFLAILGGFRGVSADLFWILAHADWERQLFYRMDERMGLVLMIQPLSVNYWTMSAWHRAWNIAYAASVDPAEKREAVRLKNQERWVQAGRETLERGLDALPESWKMWEDYARLLKEKQKDFSAAARAFGRASELPGAPEYMRRQEAFCLLSAGKKAEAYDLMRRLWLESPNNHVPTLRKRIPELEEELKIPREKRIFPQ